MLLLENSVRGYDWGTVDKIPEFLGVAATGKPMAELWMGTHPMAPSSVLSTGGTRQSLREIAGELPFMLKVLSARYPLSLQVHPDLTTAREGFDRENREGTPVDSPIRSFKDPNHKPEMVYALSTFDMIVGFRPTAEILRLLSTIHLPLATELRQRLATNPGFSGIVGLVEWLLSTPPSPTEINDLIVQCGDLVDRGIDVKRAYATALLVHREFPKDVGVVIALLMNRLTLQPGEAAFLGTGVIHAHLKGLCVEAMAASDNVLRAGLTTKHIDPLALVRCLDAGMSRVARVIPQIVSSGVEVFDPGIGDFALTVAQSSQADNAGVRLTASGPRIILCTAGYIVCRSIHGEEIDLQRGQSLFAFADDGPITLTGTGEAAEVSAPAARDGDRGGLINLV